MQVTVCVFAALKTHFKNEFSLEIDNNISISQLVEKLTVLNPLAKPVLSRCRFAIDENFVSQEYIINDEERICIIPPSSGG